MKMHLGRPNVILLIILLLEIYCSTSVFIVVKAKAQSQRPKAGYKEFCSRKEDCSQEFHCDKIRSECLCRNFVIQDLVLVYHEPLDKCVAIVGKLCTLPSVDDELWKINCVPSAKCVKSESVRQPNLFGICKCEPGYEATKHHLCEPTTKIEEVNNMGDIKKVSTLDAGLLPNWESSTTTSSNTGNNPDKTKTDKGNEGIQVHRDVENCLDEVNNAAKNKCFRREVPIASHGDTHYRDHDSLFRNMFGLYWVLDLLFF